MLTSAFYCRMYGTMLRPRRESNPELTLRRRLFYPLNYGDLHKVDAALHLNAAAKPPSDLRLSDQIPLIDQDVEFHIIAA